jgi:thiol-disulfide isomerase/thioredoxin
MLAVAAAMTLAVGCQNKALEDKVSALSARVEALEKRGAPPVLNARVEQEAQAMVQQINSLMAQGKIDEAKGKLAEIQTKYQGTNAGRQVQAIAGELAVVGKGAPQNWGIQKWFQGQNLIDLQSPKATVVVFWETWCPHCRDEVPKLQDLYANYKDKGLQLIAVTKVTQSATEDGVKEFIASNKLSYPIAREDGSLTKHFNVSGIPAAALLKNGKVVWRGHPVRLNDALLRNWL